LSTALYRGCLLLVWQLLLNQLNDTRCEQRRSGIGEAGMGLFSMKWKGGQWYAYVACGFMTCEVPPILISIEVTHFHNITQALCT
jgi:hypothetical protein